MAAESEFPPRASHGGSLRPPKTSCCLLPSPSFPSPPEKAEEDSPPRSSVTAPQRRYLPCAPVSPPQSSAAISAAATPKTAPKPKLAQGQLCLRISASSCTLLQPDLFPFQPWFCPQRSPKGVSTCCPSRLWHRPQMRRFCSCAAPPGVVQANSAVKATTHPVHRALSAGNKQHGKAKLVWGRVPTTKCPCSSPVCVEELPGLSEPPKAQKAEGNPAWPQAQPSPCSCRTHSLAASILPWQRLLDFLRLHLGDSPGYRRVFGACNEPPELLHRLLGCSKSPA